MMPKSSKFGKQDHTIPIWVGWTKSGCQLSAACKIYLTAFQLLYLL